MVVGFVVGRFWFGLVMDNLVFCGCVVFLWVLVYVSGLGLLWGDRYCRWVCGFCWWSVALGLWRYKPFGKKDQNGHFLNAVGFIGISPNFRRGLWNLLNYIYKKKNADTADRLCH